MTGLFLRIFERKTASFTPIAKSGLFLLYFHVQFRRTVGAARRFDGNFAHAIRTFFGDRGCRLFLFPAQLHKLIDDFEQAEKHQRHNEKVNQGRHKRRGETRHVLQIVSFRPGNELQNRRNKIIGQGRDNPGKGAADENAHRHIHHIAAQGERLKFFDKLLHIILSFFSCSVIPT